MKFVKVTYLSEMTPGRIRSVWINLDMVSIMSPDYVRPGYRRDVPGTKIVFDNVCPPFTGILVKETPEQIFAMEAIDSLTAEVTSDDGPIEKWAIRVKPTKTEPTLKGADQ